MADRYRYLTQEQVNSFMENGYLVIKNAFTKEKAEAWKSDMWVRLGMDQANPATWGDKERIHMPSHKREAISTFAPTAWEAMKDLLGGEDRIEPESGYWNDAFIVNFGLPEFVDAPDVDPRNLKNWHVDGDFFVHYLDSPEQALLVIPIFNEVKTRAGGTFICPEGIDIVASYLSQHPEGVLPTGLSFTPSTSTYSDKTQDPGHISLLAVAKTCSGFVEVTGAVGDVFLLHPLMLHSASRNHLRIPRVITNPPVALREPFQFNRADGKYSVVERRTLKALGVESFAFQATTERRRVVPARVAAQQKMLEEERQRLAWRSQEAQMDATLKPITA
ncbi:hypothetical protein FA95DRAFT_1608577 [Auriscalpium vulgare]|uniref:Uncharacterized protein n=1 Tax=Auriscalpium vulgare TaxID=40419 RepID=A0ACB8RJS1_9AGAM|nr:hypothetical protein FA95DRAFT_1608577 [Auriscalpium vulgare]